MSGLHIALALSLAANVILFLGCVGLRIQKNSWENLYRDSKEWIDRLLEENRCLRSAARETPSTPSTTSGA